MLLLGAALPSGQNANGNDTSAGPPASQVGRFQVASSAAMFVIVDTTSGQAWMGDFHNTLVPGNPAFFDPKLAPDPEPRRWP